MAASSLKKSELTGDGESNVFNHPGGKFIFTRHDDTATSGTTVVQFLPEGQNNWQDIPGSTLTQTGSAEITLVKCSVRASLTSHAGNSVFCYFQFFV